MTTVQPNCLKRSPVTPPMRDVGKNTTTIVNVVAITARAISLTASFVASMVDFPIRLWRTMFSTSTIASSMRIPTTTVRAKSVSVLREKPSQYMIPKVGITDKGRAIAEISVAHQSRRNNPTTIMASMAPSYNIRIEPSYCSSVFVTALEIGVMVKSGYFFLRLSMVRNVSFAICTSSAPFDAYI